MSSGLPFLPGYTFTNLRKTDFRKPQILQVSQGTMGTRKPNPEDLEAAATQKIQTIKTTAPPVQSVDTFPDYIPAHVAYEHLVLRFYSYFRETVPESADEISRVRYVKIYVYLEDDTILIEEDHVRNSGMEQGTLLRRMRVVNPNIKPLGTLYTSNDFNVGISVEICGTVYRIYDCDKFTREYFESIGKQVGETEQPPDDLYTVKRKITERPIRVTYTNTDKTNLKRFLDYDGKVLRFYAVWDDRKALFGERRKFILHFFLVDGTIEIRQVLPINSGRDPVSRLLMKTRLKKPNSNEYYEDSDMKLGAMIDVFGRSFFLYDADTFTKDYLDQKYGPHDWTPINVDSPNGQVGQSNITKTELPPYNGWGDEEDSIGFCYSLHPKPPKKDIQKMIAKEGQLLRFLAHFKDPAPQDVNRKFVISYYLMDDTVAIFEGAQRNSGFREGKFIQRGKYKNQNAGNRYFIPSDFRIGEEITINCYTFKIVDADEFALAYMEADADQFPQSDLDEIIKRIRTYQNKAQIVEMLRKQFEALDPELTGFIPVKNAEEYLTKIGLQQHEALTITRRWNDNNGFDYFSFISSLA